MTSDNLSYLIYSIANEHSMQHLLTQICIFNTMNVWHAKKTVAFLCKFSVFLLVLNMVGTGRIRICIYIDVFGIKCVLFEFVNAANVECEALVVYRGERTLI